MRSIFLCFCAVWLCGLFSATASAEPLSSEEIVKLLTGTTVTTMDNRGRDLYVKFKSDGTLAGERVGGGGVEKDDGKWWTEKSGLFCLQWENWRQGKERCNFLLLQKDGKTLKREKTDGSLRTSNWVIK